MLEAHRYMGNLSLKLKITLGITLTSVLAVIVSAWLQVQSHNAVLEKAIISDSESLFEILNDALSLEVAEGDIDGIKQEFVAATNSPTVNAVVLYDTSGKPVHWSTKNGFGAQMPPGASNELGVFQRNSEYVINRSILNGGNVVGSLYVAFDHSELGELLSESVTQGFILVAVIAAISVGVAMFVSNSVAGTLSQVVDALRDMAEGQGDLTKRIEINSNDQIGEIGHWFNIFIQRIHSIVSDFSSTANRLESASQMLMSSTAETERGVGRQQSEVQQVANAIREMASVVADVSQNVAETAENAEQADREASNGRQVVFNAMRQIESLASDINNASDVIDRLRQETDNIGSVLDVIRGIAEQTNLLALNAAIEAARAGEQGRGFAVVADEVRTLASRTQSSTQEIQEMIERLQTGAREAVSMMSKGTNQAKESVSQADAAGRSLEAITAGVSSIKSKTEQVASAAEEQSAATREIESNMQNISSVIKSAAGGARQISESSAELASLSSSMTKIVQQFRI
ncbi:hypothetical protein MAH1_03030 [Sessilibacter sp. MAH1]